MVDVLVPVALNQAYSYRVPRGMELKPGDVVCVPLGPREAIAVVWAENANPDPRLHNRLKDVSEKLDVPPLRDELRKLVDWVANYTLSARGMVLRMTLRMGEHLGPERVRMGVRLVGEPPQRMTAARRRLIAILSDRLLHGKSEAAKEAGVSTGVIDGLVDEGTLASEPLPPAPPPPPPDPSFAVPDFSRQQRTAVDAMRTLAANGSFHVALLDGVTGSGKTEVYFEAVAEVIRRGKQALILMPEIALTGQFLDRFAGRFGVRPLEWHSELTPRTRARNWAAIAAGQAQVVVGARSALFLPYADLGLIVVDEEHDQAYKQDEGAHYHARDMAVVRASIAKIPVLLASATPSLETEVNARKGRYQRVALPSRFGGQHMPHIEAIDLRRDAAAARTVHLAAAGRADPHRGRAPRAGAVVPQPPRLRAADAMPGLRASLRLHDLRCLAGGPPLSPAPGVPPLRLLDAAPACLSALRGGAIAGRGRSRRRAPAGRGGAAISGRAHDGAVERPDHLDRNHAQRAQRDRGRAASISSSAPSWWRRAIIFRGSIWSASSMPILASATAIRAPPNGRFNCSTR